MFKTKFISTYSFAKLNRSVSKIIRETVDSTGSLAEKIMKGNIDAAEYDPLTKFTKRKRREGIGWAGKKVKPTSSTVPLRQTDSLYNSLSYIKKDQTIKMNAYGKMHHKGFTNMSGLNVPPRPFMDLQPGKKGFFFNKPDKMLSATKTVGVAVTEKGIIRKLQKAFKK